ncbi:GA binding protein beta-1 chain [Giardia lamblia P15]|uniref:GA binding protein beta-1 chain n=1 Tax=Giardia intestinalis (strain P15) TaxID=658858 RepID=E1F255_GIAIA|nr:GA binding protein beta-1 chain [Giardia lamblia P15]
MTLASRRELDSREQHTVSLFLSYISSSNITEMQRLLSFPLTDLSSYQYEVPPIHICAASKNATVLDFLLRNGFSVGTPDISCDGGTILHRAAIDGSEEIARIALQHGIDVNATDASGNTALHQAIQHDHSDIVQTILKYNPDMRILNNAGLSAYQIAVSKRSDEIAKLMVPLKYDWYAAKQAREDRIRNNLLFNAEDLTSKLKKVKAKKSSKSTKVKSKK